jgi:hypothetical protein
MDKPRWRIITDQAECAALIANGKWHNDKPTWIRDADWVWVLNDEAYQAWCAKEGKRL